MGIGRVAHFSSPVESLLAIPQVTKVGTMSATGQMGSDGEAKVPDWTFGWFVFSFSLLTCPQWALRLAAAFFGCQWAGGCGMARLQALAGPGRLANPALCSLVSCCDCGGPVGGERDFARATA